MLLPIMGLSGLLEALSSARNHGAAPETDLTPLDLSHLRDLPKDTGRSDKRHLSREVFLRHAVFPPAVPNNQP